MADDDPAEYALPDALTVDDLRAVLTERLTLEDDGEEVIDRDFCDTFDGRVRRAGCGLVVQDNRLQLLSLTDERLLASDAPLPDGAPVLVAALPAGPLRDRLAPILEMRAALPVARVRLRRRVLRVLDAERKTVVRIVVQQATLAGPGRRRVPLPARVRLAAVRGYDKDLRRVARVLAQDAGLLPVAGPLVDEAVTAAGGRPLGHSSKLDIALTPTDRADRAAVTVLQHLLDAIELNLPGTLADVDSEFLHDLRVAVRRTRALQRELRDVFPPAELAAYRGAFRRLQQITGPTRDLDVHLLDFDDLATWLPERRREDLEPLRALLADRREAERRRMVRALRAPATRTTLDGWATFIAMLPDRPLEERPAAALPISEVAAGRISKVYRQMVRMGAAIDDASPPQALHDLRKKGKELRYLLEFFARLFPAEAVDPAVRTLKALQDTLGRFQDHEIQAHELRALGDEVVRRENGAAALMAMGLLAQRLEDGQVAARREFAERFAPFAAPDRRAAMKATFG